MKLLSKKGLFTKILTGLLVMVMVLTILPAVSANAAKKSYPYKIKINKSTNVVTVYSTETKKPVTAFTCSLGSATPTGTFHTKDKYRWHELMGPSYGQYCTRITDGILFHSVWYYSYEKNSQTYYGYNMLGNLASHGCCRLTVASAKWIYDNCPIGTEVKVFYGSSKDDPLGKPKTVSVSGSRGWDPTDPDPNNPYKSGSAKPKITVKSKIVQYGKNLSKDNLTIKDSCGFDITKWKGVQIKGFDKKKLGRQKVTISLLDSCGRSAKKTVTYTVVDKKKYTITLNSETLEKKVNTSRDLLLGVKAYDTSGNDVKSELVVSVKEPGSTEFVEVENPSAKYMFDKVGEYLIKYEVINPNNDKVTTKIRTINCVGEYIDPSVDTGSGIDDGFIDPNA